MSSRARPDPRKLWSFRLALLLLALLGPSGFVRAETVTWTGSGGTLEWETPENWSTGAVPDLESDVVIPSGPSPITISTGTARARSLDLSRPLTVRPLGTLSLSGVATVRARLVVSASAGLSGGQYTTVSPGVVLFQGSCTSPSSLTNVRFASDLSITAGAYLRWKNVDCTGISVQAAGAATIQLDGDQTLTGSWSTSSSSELAFYPVSNTVLTIEAGTSVRGSNLRFYGTNQCGNSAITMDVVHRGVIEGVGTGATVAIGARVAKTGSIIGPNIMINGSVDLLGGEWTLGSGTVTFGPGSEVRSGILSTGAATTLFAGTCASPVRLSDLSVHGDLRLQTNSVVRWNNVTVDGTVRASGSASIGLEGDQTLNAPLLVDGVAVTFYAWSSGTLTIGPNGVLRGGGISMQTQACNSAGTLSVVNNGLIDASIAGRTITIGATLVNNGVVNASPGIVAFTGGYFPGAGTWTGTNFSLTGVTDLGGAALNIPVATITLSGAAELRNGTVNLQGGTLNFAANGCSIPRLSGVTVNGNMTLSASSTFRWNGVVVNGTVTLPSGSASIGFEGNQTLTGTWLPNASGTLTLYAYTSGTLTVASGAVLRGGIVFQSAAPSCPTSTALSVINQGTIDGNNASRPVRLSVPVTQSGGTIRGSVSVESALDLGGGVFDEAGPVTVAAGQTVRNGTINMNGSAWTFPGICVSAARFVDLTIHGAFALNQSGTLRWSNVSMDGAVTMPIGSRILLEGDQTLTGEFVGNGGTTTPALLASWSGSATATLAPTCIVRGAGLTFASTCSSSGNELSVINNGLVDGTDTTKPIKFNVNVVGGVGTYSGAVLFDNMTVSNASLSVAATPGGAPKFSTSCNNRLSNCTIVSDWPDWGGTAKWNQVTLMGTLTLGNGGTLLVDGEQTLAGKIVGNASEGSPAYIGGVTGTSPRLIVTPSGRIEGKGLTIGIPRACGTRPQLQNDGVIEGTNAASPIRLDLLSSVSGTGRYSGAVNFNGTTFQGATIHASQTSAGSPRCAGSSASRFKNVTIEGDWVDFSGEVIWDGVVLNGTLSTTSFVSIRVNGDQTLTGTIDASTSPNASVSVLPYAASSVVLTIEESAIVRGGRVVFANTSSGGQPVLLRLVHNGRIEGLSASQPIQVASSIIGGNGTFAGSVRVGGITVDNAQMNFETNATGSPDFTSSCFNTLTNVAIHGDIPNFTGKMKWNNVFLEGTLRMQPGSVLQLAGQQTLTGRIEGNGTSDNPALIAGTLPGANTVTIAPMCVVTGVGLSIRHATDCAPGAGQQLLNLGTLEGTSAENPIDIQVPLLDAGAVVGAVQTTDELFGVEYQSAFSTDDAVVKNLRPDPGDGSLRVFEFRSLYIAPGVSFTLGAGETLNLDGGSGVIYVGRGATFRALGVVNGRVHNSGTVIVPFDRSGLTQAIEGGVVVLEPPAGAAEPFELPAGVAFPARTFVVVGSAGFGAAGNAHSGRRYHAAGTLGVPGAIAWDGLLAVDGSLTQPQDGVLRFYIAGQDRGDTYTHLYVGQTANLSGVVQIVLQPELFGYLPPGGASFDLVIAGDGISLPEPPSAIAVEAFMTAAGASSLGLSLPPYAGLYNQDPNELVRLPADLFSIQLVGGGLVLRATFNGSFCAAIAAVHSTGRCPGSEFTCSASTPGGGEPFSYRWQIADAGAPGGWSDLVDGPLVVGGLPWGEVTGSSLSECVFDHDPAAPPTGFTTRVAIASTCGFAVSGGVNLDFCRADFDCAGGVSQSDLFAYVDAWFAQLPGGAPGTPSADFDRSGDVSVADLFGFLDAWFAEFGVCGN